MSTRDTYLVIGPSEVGKTALVSTLQRAAQMRARGGLAIEVRSLNSATDELFDKFNQSIQRGEIPHKASERVTQYAFELKVSEKVFGFFPTSTAAEIRMLDGPGAAIFKGEGAGDVDFEALEKYQSVLREELKTATGLVICASAVDPKLAYTFCKDLPRMFNELRLPKLPMARVAVIVNKIDQWCSQEGLGRGSLERLQRESPMKMARAMLRKQVFGALRQFLPDSSQVGFGFASAYGFIEDEGSPNYDANTGGMKLRLDQGADVLDHWEPYKVLDPFVFVTSGRRMGLEVVAARDLP